MKWNARLTKIKKTAKEKPLFVVLAVIVSFFLLVLFLDALELMPEFERIKWGEGRGIDKGDNLVWLGMELAPVSRSIRKEFNIPRKVKGMFVVNEGRGFAKKRGVKACDVICSVNRKKVSSRRSFIKIANDTKYYDGILLDLYRDGKHTYVSVPFLFEHGPLFGPNKGHWQLGSPLIKQLLPYGEILHRGQQAPNREQ